MIEQLQAIGLSKLQATAYVYLLDFVYGRKPAQIAEDLSLTRTNAYKILDSLHEIRLVRKSDASKKLTYYAEDPIVLTNFVADARNRARELENQVKESLSTLQKKYEKHSKSTDLRTSHGKIAIINAFKKQLRRDGEIFFIKSRADIPFMGHQTMRALREEPMKYGMRRHGITPDSKEINRDPAADARTALTRTLLPEHEYTSPVEWTVSGDELAIIVYADDGHTIRICNPMVADSFRQVWKSLNRRLS